MRGAPRVPTCPGYTGLTTLRNTLWIGQLKSSYGRELSRVLGVPLAPVQRALRGLELDGLVAGRAVGRTRLFTLNPSYLAKRELAAYLGKLADADPELQRAVTTIRRRPRRTGKPP